MLIKSLHVTVYQFNTITINRVSLVKIMKDAQKQEPRTF